MATSKRRCSCVQNGACLCSGTWVLVIHNDFEGKKEFRRHGDGVDVKNLRRVFETQRGCTFRELHNRGSEEIVQTLAQEELLIQLFHPYQPEDPLISPPEALVLFILSHGESGGVILTNHFKEDTNPDDFQFETYNTNDVWNLAKMDFFSSSLKLLFLGPCRGNLTEFKLLHENRKKKIPTLPGWLSSKPNKENFVILYATVESTMAHRSEADGTWFVEAICKELENLTQNLPLLDFITRIQFQLCAKNTFGDNSIGQTSQLHFFHHEKFTMCASKNLSTENRKLDLTLSKKEQTDYISHRDVASTSFHWTNEANDAKAGNLAGLVKSFDKRFTYNWLDKKGIQLKRGKALIFHDGNHYACALKMGFNLQRIGYAISLHDICNLRNIITQTCPKRGFKHDGSFVVCVLAQIRETENGLVIRLAKKSFQLSKIIDEYTGTKCPQLIGKPKLFFFLDDRVMWDGKPDAANETTIISSGYKYFNLHAGVCTFVGVRSGPRGSGGDVVENLIQALGSPLLKEEGSNLQTVLSEVISKAAEKENTEDYIKPQFFSTLPQVVNFPIPKSSHQQEKYSSLYCVFGAAVLMSVFLGIMMIVLGYLMHTPKYLLVNVDGSCGVSFTRSDDVLATDAFSLNSSDWYHINEKCSGVWRRKYPADYEVINSVSGSQQQNAMQELEKSDKKRESLQRIILFGYTSVEIFKWIRFSSFLDGSYLQIDFLRSLVAKIAGDRVFRDIAVLELSRVKSLKQLDQITQNLVQTWTKGIIDQTCQDLMLNNNNVFNLIKQLSNDAQEHFLPLIIVKCYHNYSLRRFEDLLYNTRDLFPEIACSTYQMICSEIEKQRQLGSEEAFQLRLFSETFQYIPIKEAERQKCKDVVDILKLHFHEHALPYLQMYDNGRYENRCSNISSMFGNYWTYTKISNIALDLVFTYLVEMRYNGTLESAATIIKCLKNVKDAYVYLIGTLALAQEFKLYNKLASFESLNSFSAFKYFSGGLYYPRNNKTKKYEQKIIDIAPHWIQEFMFDSNTIVCDYRKNQTCTDSVIQDLESIITDFESRNLTKRREILFLDFVLNSINKSAEVWRKVEPLKNRTKQFKQQMLTAMGYTFLGNHSTNDDDNAILLYNYFGANILNGYLPAIVQEAYLIGGIQGMPRYLESLELIYKSYNDVICEGAFSLYLAIQRNIENLETIEALFFKCYVFAVIQLPTDDQLFDSSDKTKCKIVVEGLSNYSKTGLDEYEKYFRKNDTKSLKILSDWQKEYKYSLLWTVPQLIKGLQSKNETFEFPILHLLQKLPSDAFLCPGIKGLNDSISCNVDRDVSCANLIDQLCIKLVQIESKPYVDNYVLNKLCNDVKVYRCRNTQLQKYLKQFSKVN